MYCYKFLKPYPVKSNILFLQVMCYGLIIILFNNNKLYYDLINLLSHGQPIL